MLNISQELKDAIKTQNVHKDVIVRIPESEITLTNSDILVESMTLHETIEAGNNLTFTGCSASSFSIETVDIVEDIQGKAIEVDLVIEDFSEEPVPLFRGYVDTMTNTTHEEYTTKLTCYDALYKLSKRDVAAWYNSLSFPISIRDMRYSFFSYVGITQQETYLVNDPMTVYKTIEDSVIEGIKILKYICNINGVYGMIGRDGTFKYIELVEGTEALYPREDLFPADDIYPSAENALENVNKAYYQKISFENYRVDPINKVQLVDKEGQIISTYGTGDNAFTVKDNPLIWGKSASELAQVAINLYNTVQGLWYTPSKVETIGLPYVECGDFVLMATRRSIVRAYVLDRELRGIQSLKDSYTARGDKKQPPYTPSIKQQVTANAQAISNEVSRATSAETAERNRATSAENNLNNSIGSVNNRVSGVYSELVDTKNLVATKASINDLNVTNNLVATKANISDLNAANARIDNLSATKLSTSDLSSKISQLSLVTFRSMNGNNITVSSLSAGSATVNGRNVDSRFSAIEGYITRFAQAMQAHGWSY